jgi:hypothetical protein
MVLAMFVFGSVRTQAAQPGQPVSGAATAHQAIALAEMPTGPMSFTLMVDQTDVMVGDEVMFMLMQDVVSPTEEMTVTFHFGDGMMAESMFVSGTATISVSHMYEYPSVPDVYTPWATVVVSDTPYTVVPDMGMDEITVRPRLTMTAVPTQVVQGGMVLFEGKIWPQITNIMSPNNEFVHISSVDEMGMETFSTTLPISMGLGWKNVEDYTMIQLPVPNPFFEGWGWWEAGKTYTITARYVSGLYGPVAAMDDAVVHVLPAPVQAEIESFMVNGTEAPADLTVQQGDETEFQVMTTMPVTKAMARYYVRGMDHPPMMTKPFTGTMAPTMVYTYPLITEAISYMVYAEIVDTTMMEVATSEEITLTVEVPYLDAISVSADPTSIQIGGSESTIMAMLSDQNGNPWMMEEEVTFTTTAGSFSADEMMNEMTVMSSEGQASVTLYSGDEPASEVMVMASVGDLSAQVNVAFTRPGETEARKYVVGNEENVTLTSDSFMVIIPPGTFPSANPNLMMELMAGRQEGLPEIDSALTEAGYIGLGYMHLVCYELDEEGECPEPENDGIIVSFTYTNPAPETQAAPAQAQAIQLESPDIAWYNRAQEKWEELEGENVTEGNSATVEAVTMDTNGDFAGIGMELVEGNWVYLPLLRK